MESIIRNDVPKHVNTSWVLKQNDYIFVCRRKIFTSSTKDKLFGTGLLGGGKPFSE